MDYLYGHLPMLMFLKKTSNMQKSAVRLIVNARYNEHSEPIFKQTKILPLSEITFSLIYNLCKGLLMVFYLACFHPPGPIMN